TQRPVAQQTPVSPQKFSDRPTYVMQRPLEQEAEAAQKPQRQSYAQKYESAEAKADSVMAQSDDILAQIDRELEKAKSKTETVRQPAKSFDERARTIVLDEDDFLKGLRNQ
ncbi:MAG: hypothetical protein IIY88_03595, partial [Eubacterium sp.]|nr:hypothetical protein [Eubacterium sp.]